MPELAYKRRLRYHKRRIVTTLEAQGYRVRSFDDGPFHLQACRGKTALVIRLCFGASDENDISCVSREPLPERCLREIWQIDETGKVTVKAKISKTCQ